MRQAGLSQLPLSMGTPVAQAGLTPPGAAAAGTPMPFMSMRDRTDMISGMLQRGMSYDEIQNELMQAGIIPPPEEPEVAPPEPATLGDVFRFGSRDMAGMAVRGAGTAAERLGREGAMDAAEQFAEERFGLTPEEQEARALRAEDQSLPAEIGDAAVGTVGLTGAMLTGGVVGGWLGGVAGSALGPFGAAAGATAGRAAGQRFGGFVGTMIPAMPTMIGSALERAKEHGHDVSDPEVQNKVIATGAGRAVLEAFGIERLGSKLLGPAADAAQRSLARAAARGGTQYAAIEAAAEAAGEILEIAVFDPEVREQLTEGEYAQLTNYMQERYGRDLVVGMGAGALVGGGIGAPGTTWQQNKTNAQRAQDIETLVGVAEEGGVAREQLEAAAQDPAQVPALAQAAREIGQARRDIQQAQTVMDAVEGSDSPELIQQAQERYAETVRRADETYDRVMKPFGALTSQQIETRKEQTAQRAREALVDADLATPEAVQDMDRQTVGAYAQQIADAQSRFDAANEAMRGGDMYDSARRQEAQQELQAATENLQRVRDDISVRTGRTTPEGVAREARQRQEQQQYEEAAARHYERKFEPLMTRDPEAAAVEAERVIKQYEGDPNKGINAAIRKLETKLDRATSVEEIGKLEAEIADKRARVGRQPPIVAAARRVLESVGPRQGDAGVQGESPASARQTPEPEATTATATPDAAPTAPASVPEPAQGSPEAAPEASPSAPTPAAVPEGAATSPQSAPAPGVAPQQARLPAALRRAAPRYAQDQVQFGNDIDKAAYITAQRKPSKRDADYLQFVQDHTGMSPEQVRAHGSRVRDAIAATPAVDGVRAVAPVPPAAPEVAPEPAVAPEPQQAMERMRQAHQRREVADPADIRAAAPSILDQGAALRAELNLPPETTPGDMIRGVHQGASQETYDRVRTQLAMERDIAHTTGLPIDATIEQMRQTVADPSTVYAIPVDGGQTIDSPAPDAAQQQARAELDTAATQARLDREYLTPEPPQFTPDKQRSRWADNYVDATAAFGRRTSTVKQARDFVVEQGARTGHEYMVTIDRATGEVLGAGTINHPSMVFPSDAAVDALASGRAVDFIHNHPRGTTLSAADMAFMYQYPGTARVTAVAPDGTSYTAEPTDAGRKAMGARPAATMRSLLGAHTGTPLNTLYNRTLEAWIREGVVSSAADGGIAQIDSLAAARGIKRAMNRAMAQEGLMRYTEAGPREVITSREQAAYDHGVKNARQAIRDALALPAGARSRSARTRSRDVQRPGTVRSGRRQTATRQGRDTADDGGGLGESDARPDAGLSAVASVGRDRGGRSSVARAPRAGETVAGLTPAQAYETTNGTTVYEVTAPQDFTQRAQSAVETMGPIGAQVGTDPGTRQFLMHDGRAGFALDGDNIISVFTTAGAPNGVMDAVLELGVDEGGRRLDAFDTFLPPAYARRGFRAVARLPFSREYAPEGWDYGFYQNTFGNSDPDVVFMVYDPENASPDTDNVIDDYGDGIAAQQSALDTGGLAEAADLPEIKVADVRRGHGAGRQSPTWFDFSAELDGSMDADRAAAEVSRRGAQKGFEHAVIYRDDGALLGAGTNKDRNAVALSYAATEYFRNTRAPYTMVHNHPDPTPLSWGDMNLLFRSTSPMTLTAVLPDGSRETATLTPAALNMAYAPRMDILQRAEEQVYDRIRDANLAGSVLRAAAMNRALARAGVIDYTAGLPDPTDPRAQEAIDAAVAEILGTHPALRDARDTGRSDEQGGSAPDAATDVGPEAVRSIRSRSEAAIANARPDREITGKAAVQQYPDPMSSGLAESADIPGLSPDAQAALAQLRDRLRANRDAFKAARPDLHPMVMDSEGNPLVVFHGTQEAGFSRFEPGHSGIFSATNPDTAVTYSGEYFRGLADKIARFRTDNVPIDELLTSPELARDFEVNIRKVGRLVDSDSLAAVIPEGSRWDGLFFPDGRPDPDGLLDIRDVPVLDSQIAEIQQELGITPEQWAEQILSEPYYQVLTTNNVPLTDAPPFPVARDVKRMLTARKGIMGVDPPSTSSRRGQHYTGDVYPLFVDMTNPLVIDYQGRDWHDAPPTLVRAFLQAPDGTWSQMDFDYADYGGTAQAQELADAWVAQQATEMYGGLEQARAAEATPTTMHRPRHTSTNAWAVHARQQGYDGVIFQNIRDSGSRIAPVDDVFVVFRPEQFKHALDNQGEFNRQDPNILAEDHSVPEMQEAADRFRAAEKRAKKILQPPAWLDVKTQQGSALKAAIDIAKTPGVSKKFAREVERQAINQLAPIRNYTLDRQGELGIGMDDAFKASEIAINDPGRNEALLYYGAAKIGPDGEFRVAENTIGLHTMLKKLPDGEAVLDWMEYMGARRAKEIRAKGLETPLSDADIEAGLAKETELFKEVAADWKRFNDANVDFLVQTGRISRALATTLKQDAAYIPFYRSEETLQGINDLMDDAGIRKASISRRGGAVLARDPGIKKLTGGKTRKVNNLIENMIRNSQAMIGAGMRNMAANKTFDMLSEAGDVSLKPARKRTADGDYVNVAMPKGAVRMWKNGKESYVVPETQAAIPVILAMAGMQPVRLGGIHKAMAAIGSFFRQSITLSPSFIVRNMIRDAISTGVLFQGKNLTMENNMFKGFMSSLRHSASRQAYTAQSGMGDFRFGGTDIGLGKNDLLIELGVMQPTKLGALGYQFRRAVAKVEAVGTASELSNRIATYDALVDAGVRPDEAAYQALTITNYSRKGANDQLQMLLPLVPFLNARIQGLSRVWEDAVAKRGPQRQQALMKLAISGGLLAAASALLWGWNNMDPERREDYQSEPLHRRLNYHIFYTENRKIMIPKAFEVGTLFGTIPELFMQAAVEKDTSELGQAAVMTLVNTFSFNPIPQAVLPALELTANYNMFTGRPIEGQRLASLMREDRINPQTTALAAGLARSGLGSFTGLSPVQMDHLLAGYGGVAYTSLASTIDAVGGELGMLPARPTGVFGEIPVINSALENTFRSMYRQRDADPANRFVEDFYDTRAAITQIYRSARAAALTGDVERARRLLAEAPATPAAYRLVNRAGAQLSDLNNAIRQVQGDPKLSSAQKRKKLDALIRERNRIAAEITRVIQKAEAAQDVTFRRAAA